MKIILHLLFIGNALLAVNSKALSDGNCNCNEKHSDDYPLCGDLEGVKMSFRGSQDLQCHAVCRNVDIMILYTGPCRDESHESVSPNYKIPEICSCDTYSSDNKPVCVLLKGKRKTFSGPEELDCYTNCEDDAHIEILHDSECKEDKFYDNDNKLLVELDN